jgi:hypothetical protein
MASNTSVNHLTSLLNYLPTNISSAVFPDYIDQTPSAFWNALFEFHRSICDQTIETSVILTKVEELFEDHVQSLIGRPLSAQSFPIEDRKQDKL